MKTGIILLGVAMLMAMLAQFFATPEKRRGSPVAVFFVGGYWFDELKGPGRALLVSSWIVALGGLVVTLNALDMW